MNTDRDDEVICAAEDRAAKATPGPWIFWDKRGVQGTNYRGEPVGLPLGWEAQGVIVNGSNCTVGLSAEDNQFITHARSDIPALIEIARRREKAIKFLLSLHTHRFPSLRAQGFPSLEAGCPVEQEVARILGGGSDAK